MTIFPSLFYLLISQSINQKNLKANFLTRERVFLKKNKKGLNRVQEKEDSIAVWFYC